MKTSLVGLDEIEVKSEERSCVEPEGNWCLKGDDNDRREGNYVGRNANRLTATSTRGGAFIQ